MRQHGTDPKSYRYQLYLPNHLKFPLNVDRLANIYRMYIGELLNVTAEPLLIDRRICISTLDSRIDTLTLDRPSPRKTMQWATCLQRLKEKSNKQALAGPVSFLARHNERSIHCSLCTDNYACYKSNPLSFLPLQALSLIHI